MNDIIGINPQIISFYINIMNLFHLQTINLLSYLYMNNFIDNEQHDNIYNKLSKQYISDYEIYDIYKNLLSHDFKKYKDRYIKFLKEFEKQQLKQNK